MNGQTKIVDEPVEVIEKREYVTLQMSKAEANALMHLTFFNITIPETLAALNESPMLDEAKVRNLLYALQGALDEAGVQYHENALGVSNAAG